MFYFKLFFIMCLHTRAKDKPWLVVSIKLVSKHAHLFAEHGD